MDILNDTGEEVDFVVDDDEPVRICKREEIYGK